MEHTLVKIVRLFQCHYLCGIKIFKCFVFILTGIYGCTILIYICLTLLDYLETVMYVNVDFPSNALYMMIHFCILNCVSNNYTSSRWSFKYLKSIVFGK